MQRLLFVDDLRYPAEHIRTENYTVARTVADAIDDVLRHGAPTLLSLDHDLGGDETAMLFVNWLIAAHQGGRFDITAIDVVNIHSENPIGAKNLASKLESFFNFIGSPRTVTIDNSFYLRDNDYT